MYSSYFNYLQTQMPRYQSHDVDATATTNTTVTPTNLKFTNNSSTSQTNLDTLNRLRNQKAHFHIPISAVATAAAAALRHPLPPFQHTPSVSPVELSSIQFTPDEHNDSISKPSNHKSSYRGKKVKDSEGKTKRIRTCYTPYQLKVMEESFACQIYLVNESRTNLASELNLSETQVKVWFQNRRIKQRKLDAIAESKKLSPSQ